VSPKIEIGHNVRTTRMNVLDSPLFKAWAARVEGWNIPEITFHNIVTNKAGKVLIIQMSALRGGINYAVMLRGESVDVLTMLICNGKRYVAHVSQERVALGERDQWSNVAGFVDHGESPRTALGREAFEELGVELPPGEIIDLNGRAFRQPVEVESMVVSAGATDELVYFFAREIVVTPEQLEILQDAIAGLEVEGEKTHVHLTPLHTTILEIVPLLARVNRHPEVKAVTSVLLYHVYVEQS
jgi:ADP-ribose pyrophosphatase YjhB (NUDIX family)